MKRFPLYYSLQNILPLKWCDILTLLIFCLYMKCSFDKVPDIASSDPGGSEVAVVVNGKVRANDSLVSGVKIIWFRELGTLKDSTLTDSNGTYRIEIKNSGRYYFIYTKDNFISITDSVDIDTEKSEYILNVQLLKIPVPAHIECDYDTILAIVALQWEKFAIDTKLGQGYHIEVSQSEDTNTYFSTVIYAPSYAETLLFVDGSNKTIDQITKKYKIQIQLSDGSSGGWGILGPITFKRPTTPPSPECSLTNTYGTREVNVFYSVPERWWIDSLLVFRSIQNSDTLIRIKSLPITTNRSFIDTVDLFPPSITDSSLRVGYVLQTKSADGVLSAFSPQKSINVINYSISLPDKPWFFDSTYTGNRLITDRSIEVSFKAFDSPVPRDSLEYRLLIHTLESDTMTVWYKKSPINVKFSHAGTYDIRCQARSQRFPTLLSPPSDTLELKYTPEGN